MEKKYITLLMCIGPLVVAIGSIWLIVSKTGEDSHEGTATEMEAEAAMCSAMGEACVKGGCCDGLVCTDKTGQGLEEKYCVASSMCKLTPFGALDTVDATTSNFLDDETRTFPPPGHPFIPGMESERGPCPGNNAIANYGYVPRNGKEVSMEEAAEAMSEMFGLELATARQVFAVTPIQKINSTHYNINDLYRREPNEDPPRAEKEGSLLRKDRYIDIQEGGNGDSLFSEELWQQMLDLAVDECYITWQELGQFGRNRILDSRRNNPHAYFPLEGGFKPSAPPLSESFRIASAHTFDTASHMVAAGDDNMKKAYFEDLRPPLEEGRLPDGWVPRQFRGLVRLSKDPGTLGGDRILSYFPGVVEAITQPLEETAMAAATNVSVLDESVPTSLFTEPLEETATASDVSVLDESIPEGYTLAEPLEYTTYPIINFIERRGALIQFRKEYNTSYIMGHCGFFAFNFFNLCYIFLFEGLIMRRLRKNRLLQLAAVSAAFQLASCVTSIHRYNINDEYGPWAPPGNILTLIAIIPLNGVYLNLLFPFWPRVRIAGWTFWTLLNVIAAIVGQINFDQMENPFSHIRTILGVSWFFEMVALGVGHYYVKKDRLSISPKIMEKQQLLTLFKVLFAIICGVLVIMIFGFLCVSIWAAGSSFTVMVIAMIFVGRMDHMQETDADSSTEEGMSGEVQVGDDEEGMSGEVQVGDEGVPAKEGVEKAVSHKQLYALETFEDDSMMTEDHPVKVTKSKKKEDPPERNMTVVSGSSTFSGGASSSAATTDKISSAAEENA